VPHPDPDTRVLRTLLRDDDDGRPYSVVQPRAERRAPRHFPLVTPPDTMNAITAALSAASGATLDAGATTRLPAKL